MFNYFLLINDQRLSSIATNIDTMKKNFIHVYVRWSCIALSLQKSKKSNFHCMYDVQYSLWTESNGSNTMIYHNIHNCCHHFLCQILCLLWIKHTHSFPNNWYMILTLTDTHIYTHWSIWLTEINRSVSSSLIVN